MNRNDIIGITSWNYNDIVSTVALFGNNIIIKLNTTRYNPVYTDKQINNVQSIVFEY